MSISIMRALPKRIILHCSASPDYPSVDPKFDSITADTINGWHIARGFTKVGYHFIIRRSGKLEQGRYLDQFSVEIGAHTQGENHDSIGICLVGTRHFMPAQLEKLRYIAKEMKLLFGIGRDAWHGHNEFAAKECPGISMDEVKKLFDF